MSHTYPHVKLLPSKTVEVDTRRFVHRFGHVPVVDTVYCWFFDDDPDAFFTVGDFELAKKKAIHEARQRGAYKIELLA